MNQGHNRAASGQDSHRSKRWRVSWVFFGFLAIAGFFLLTEHRAHLMGALPFILLALCPLMHFFHGSHGKHGSHAGPGGESGRGVADGGITPLVPSVGDAVPDGEVVRPKPTSVTHRH